MEAAPTRRPVTRTELHFAARSNTNPAVLQSLLDAGADVEALDDGGDTPLHWAVAGNTNPAVIKVLLAAGADVEARNGYGDTPLHAVLASLDDLYNRHNKISYYSPVMQLLIDAGADIEARNSRDDTVLESGTGFYGGLPEAVLLVLRKAAAQKMDLPPIDEE